MKIRLIKLNNSCGNVWKIEKKVGSLLYTGYAGNDHWENYFYPSDLSYLSYEAASKDYDDIKNGKLYKGFEVIKEDEI